LIDFAEIAVSILLRSMSIINDALKKARSGDPQSGSPGEEPPIQPRQVESARSDFTILFWVGSAATGILVVVIVGAVWVLSYWETSSDLDDATLISPEIPASEEALRGRPPQRDTSSIVVETERLTPGLTTETPATLDPMAHSLEASTGTLPSELIDTPSMAEIDLAEAKTPAPRIREDIHQISRDLRIQGVSLAEGNRRVLIDGHFLAEGDLLQDSASIRIASITADYILLRDDDGEEVRLRY